MVFLIECSKIDQKFGDYEILYGSDKQENDMLLQYKCLYDIWFHIDDLPSTHVQLRSNNYQKVSLYSESKNFKEQYRTILDSDLQQLKMICGCICKLNSKDGRKSEQVKIIFTPSANVVKSKSNIPGQVTQLDGKMNQYFPLNKSDIDKQELKKISKVIEDLGKMNEEELNNRKQTFNNELNRIVKDMTRNKMELDKKAKQEMEEKKKMQGQEHLVFDDDEYQQEAVDDDEFM